MTLLQLIKTIKRVSLSIPNVNSVVDEFLDLNDVTAKYSSVILQQRTHRRNNDFMVFSFYLGYSDRLTENKDNEVEVQSTAIQVIDDIVYKLENLNFDCTVGVYNTFTQRFLAEAAGGYVELDIVVPMGECEDDFSKEELDTTITANGVYTWLPKGLGFESVKINVDVAHLQDKSLDITKNGNYKVQYDKGYSGLRTVDVNVNVPSGEIKNQTKEELITINNKRYTYTPDKDYTGIGELNVMVQIPEQPIYEEGYVVGKEDGINEQKRKLTDINITQNGTYEKEDGYKSVVVNVPSNEKPETELTKTLTANDTYTYTPEDGTVYNKVIITTDIHPTERLERTYVENGQYLIDGEYKDGVINVDVPVPEINNQEKSITINSNGTSSVVPDAGYTGISKVDITVNVPTSGGDGIDLTSLGYTAQENTKINTDIQDSIAYSQSLLKSYTDDTKYISNLKLVFAPKIPSTNRTNFMELFSDCSNLKTIPSIDTSNGVRFEKMFLNCVSLYTIPAIDTSNCTSFYQTFFGCKSLNNIPNLNMLNVDSCNSMFDACESLTSVYPLNIPKCRILSSMFYACSSLTSIEFIDMSSATSFNSMFGACPSLVSVKNIDLSKCVNADYMFQGCSSLTDINLIGNINVSISFETSPNLTYDSIKSILTACSNATETTKTKKVTFNQSITDKNQELTNLVASCTSKGWIVSGLTITTA